MGSLQNVCLTLRPPPMLPQTILGIHSAACRQMDAPGSTGFAATTTAFDDAAAHRLCADRQPGGGVCSAARCGRRRRQPPDLAPPGLPVSGSQRAVGPPGALPCRCSVSSKGSVFARCCRAAVAWLTLWRRCHERSCSSEDAAPLPRERAGAEQWLLRNLN